MAQLEIQGKTIILSFKVNAIQNNYYIFIDLSLKLKNVLNLSWSLKVL